MSTHTTELLVVRPEGWDVPDMFTEITDLKSLRTTIGDGDDEYERLLALANGVQRDTAYGVATLGLSIFEATERGVSVNDIAVALGYELTREVVNEDGTTDVKRITAGPTFVGRYAVIGQAVSHGCDTDTVLALRQFVRDNGKGKAEAVVNAAKTDEGMDNDKLARAIVKAGKPVKVDPPADEQLTKRLTAAHNALVKVVEALTGDLKLTEANIEQVSNIDTLVNAIKS